MDNFWNSPNGVGGIEVIKKTVGGHFYELPDRLAKQKAEEVWKGTIEADSVISINGALRLARDVANNHPSIISLMKS